MLESFRRLTGLDLGFRPEGITSVSLPLPQKYGSAATANPFFATVVDRVRAVPGVRSAALAWGLPFEGQANYDGFLIGDHPAPPNGSEGQTYQIGVSPGYFATLGIPMRFGRDFLASDDTTSVPVAVVDETIAKRYWKGAEAIGKRIRTTGDTTWFSIVGVVGSIHDGDATRLEAPHLYVSLAQTGAQRVSLAIRTSGDPASAIRSVRGVLGAIEPAIPLDGVRTLSSMVGDSLATKRLAEILLVAFAAVAVVLAAVGIYGVMSLSVANRSREFGVRLAVGAEPGALVRLVLREGAMLAAAGVGIGVVGAFAATRWMSSLLFEVSPTEPVVFASLSLLLGAIAVAACFVPARRAARSDPLVALRAD
jgi:predicted permease